jgi:hypothetical protein
MPFLGTTATDSFVRRLRFLVVGLRAHQFRNTRILDKLRQLERGFSNPLCC